MRSDKVRSRASCFLVFGSAKFGREFGFEDGVEEDTEARVTRRPVFLIGKPAHASRSSSKSAKPALGSPTDLVKIGDLCTGRCLPNANAMSSF